MAITQLEFDLLLKEEKVFDDVSKSLALGPAPISWTRQINSLETNNIFLLDYYRGSFELSKYTYNKRYKQTIILLRYDNRGRHTNPDGISFDGPHIHIFKEGYNDKFAYPISEIGIEESDTIEIVLNKILHICNVTKLPSIEIPMF